MWKQYSDHGRDSEVVAYQIITQGIVVRFRNRTEYTYTNASAGSEAIQEMHLLAVTGLGLNSYISQSNPGFSSKRVGRPQAT